MADISYGDDGTSSSDVSISVSGSSDASMPAESARMNDDFDVPARMDGSLLDDNDSVSDVSMSADSEDGDMDSPNESTEPTQSYIPHQNGSAGSGKPYVPGSLQMNSRKRRKSLSSDDGPMEGLDSDDVSEHMEPSKRIRLDESSLDRNSCRTSVPDDRSALPAEIWHHILTFTPPRILGRLLRVNKLFKSYLDPKVGEVSLIPAPLPASAVSLRRPENIWQVSRRLFRPGMPAPLQDLSELDMWKIAGNEKCSFCDKQEVHPILTDPWHSGPGENSVTPIWPFAVRSCKSCLQARTVKEIDLLLSSTVPTSLMAALPFTFLTSEFHVVSPLSLRNNQPPGLEITKLFYRPHIEEIKIEFFRVKSMGSATAEEWLKGLDGRGKERRQDTLRWDRWSLSGGLSRIRSVEPSEIYRPISRSPSVIPSASPPALPIPNIMEAPRVSSFGSAKSYGLANESSATLRHAASHFVPPGMSPPRFESPAQGAMSNFGRQFPPPRHERTREEVAELKSTRRAEIERRAMLLEPPINPGVLSHMASFQAAIQIIKPLDDNNWEMLKPRLLSQRGEAEQKENDLLSQVRSVQKSEDRRYNDGHRENAETVDKEWELIQAPIKERIGVIADEYIASERWADGDLVSKDNCPKFAVDVLIYVRQRFYAEANEQKPPASGAGSDISNDNSDGLDPNKLVLENMKWIFDTKIKPHTEQYRKEIFLCSVCENTSKFFGFEGVIQHYAAKHTSALSLGSIVVHWRAEWPEEPPFHTDPFSARNSHYSKPRSNGSYSNTDQMFQQSYGRYPAAPGHTEPPAQSFRQTPVAAFYGAARPEDHYMGNQGVPFHSAPPYQGSPQIFAPSPYPPPSSGGFPTYHSNINDYQPQGFGGGSHSASIPGNTAQTFGSPNHSQMFSASAPEYPGVSGFVAQTGGQGQYYPQGVQGVPARTEEDDAYANRLEDAAQNAAALWKATSGIKNLPANARVYIVFHHLVKRFKAKFGEDPSLSLLIDGLSNNKNFRPIRNINALACKACSLADDLSGTQPSNTNDTEKKRFSLPQLFNHFQATHTGKVDRESRRSAKSSRFDWTKDMLTLPDLSVISLIARMPDIDSQKLRLIAEAIPAAFQTPAAAKTSNISKKAHKSMLPKTANVQEPSSKAATQEPNDSTDQRELAPSQDNHDKFYRPISRGPEHDQSPKPFEGYHRGVREATEPISVYPRSIVKYYVDDHMGSYETTDMPGHYVERRARSPIHRQAPSDDYARQMVRVQPRGYPSREGVYFESQNEYPIYHGRINPPLDYEDSADIERPYAPNVPRRRVRRADDSDIAMRGPRRSIDPTLFGPYTDKNASTKPTTSSMGGAADPVEVHGHRSSGLSIDADGSEDGELLVESSATQPLGQNQSATEAETAAKQFLENLVPENDDKVSLEGREELQGKSAERTYFQGSDLRASSQLRHQGVEEADYNERYLPQGVRPMTPAGRYMMERRIPRQRPIYAYEYDDQQIPRYVTSTSGAAPYRERSPELVDHRYKRNNVIHRDNRPSSHNTHRTPSRYARYESVRLETDSERPRSPIYVKVGAQPGHLRERSPQYRASEQETVYRGRSSPPPADEIHYERAPRREYYQVYNDEHRSRQPAYERPIEYIQISEHGEYVVRRPLRREPEHSMYSTYDEDQYARETGHERAPMSRSDPAYFEEYDPRNPAPLPPASAREIRYQ